MHLKMFKTGCMLNVIYYNKLCIACSHLRTPTVPVRIRLLTFSWHLTQLCWSVRLHWLWLPGQRIYPRWRRSAFCFIHLYHSCRISRHKLTLLTHPLPPSLSVGSLACLWHARLFGTRLITARGLVINQGHVERDSRGPPVFQTIPPLSPVSHFRWPVLQVQAWAKGSFFLIN